MYALCRSGPYQMVRLVSMSSACVDLLIRTIKAAVLRRLQQLISKVQHVTTVIRSVTERTTFKKFRK